MKKLITHNGSFHTDDVFAAATLSILLERQGEAVEIVRTRDESLMKNADYVFDVGGIYDEAANRFDHHQPGGAGGEAVPSKGEGQVKIEYSSFGLIWKKFGAELCGSQKVADIVKNRLVAPIDAHDNGVDLVKNLTGVSQYIVQNIFFSMHPTWREDNITNDQMFFESVEIGKKILLREIAQSKDFVLAEDIVISFYENAEDKRIIVWDKHYPCEDVLGKFPEPLFFVYPKSADGTWAVKAVRDDIKSFKNRKDLPASWAGLRDEELQKVSGVPDAVFCHRALFVAVAKSKEGAIKLAQIAVEY